MAIGLARWKWHIDRYLVSYDQKATTQHNTPTTVLVIISWLFYADTMNFNRPTPFLHTTFLDASGVSVTPQVSMLDLSSLQTSGVPTVKRQLVSPTAACPDGFEISSSRCRYEHSPQAYTVFCISNPGMRAQLINQECLPTQLCVQLDRPADPNTLDLRTRAYCVEYEYFARLAQVYQSQGRATAGSIVSQMNLNPAQRAGLASRDLGIAAVLTGLDNHTSVLASNLSIEADGVGAGDSGGPIK